MVYNVFEVMALTEDMIVSWDASHTKAAASTVFDVSFLSLNGSGQNSQRQPLKMRHQRLMFMWLLLKLLILSSMNILLSDLTDF